MNIGGIPLVGIMKINLVDFLVGIMGNHHKPWRTNQPICRLMIDTARYKYKLDACRYRWCNIKHLRMMQYCYIIYANPIETDLIIWNLLFFLFFQPIQRISFFSLWFRMLQAVLRFAPKNPPFGMSEGMSSSWRSGDSGSRNGSDEVEGVGFCWQAVPWNMAMLCFSQVHHLGQWLRMNVTPGFSESGGGKLWWFPQLLW